MFNFGLSKYFLLLMIATAGATGAVQTNVEQLERNRLHKEHFYDALNVKIWNKIWKMKMEKRF